MYSRREIATIGLAGLAAPLAGLFAGGAADVHLGVNTSSFGNLTRALGTDPIDALIQALVACDVHECELSAGQVEPRFGGGHVAHHTMSSMSPQMMRRELRKWRLRTPAAYFAAIGARFRKAGIAIHAYNYSPNRSFTDEEINQGFISARALGADLITASTTADVARRVAPFADRHRMIVAIGEDSDSSIPPRLDVETRLEPKDIDFYKIWEYLNKKSLFVLSWGIRGEGAKNMAWSQNDFMRNGKTESSKRNYFLRVSFTGILDAIIRTES